MATTTLTVGKAIERSRSQRAAGKRMWTVAVSLENDVFAESWTTYPQGSPYSQVFGQNASAIDGEFIVSESNPKNAILTLWQKGKLFTDLQFPDLPARAFDSGEVPVVGGETTLLYTLNGETDISVDPIIPPVDTAPPEPEITLPVYNTQNLAFFEIEKRETNAPVELYRFSWGSPEGVLLSENHRGYTSGNAVVKRFEKQVDGTEIEVPYEPESIKRNELQQTTDAPKATLSLTVPKNNEIAAMFIAGTPIYPIFVEVFRGHQIYQADSVYLEYTLMFTGRISTCTFQGFEATMDCDSVFISLKRQGLKQKYESMCCHALYDAGSCNLDKNAPEIKMVIGANCAEIDAYGAKITITGDAAFSGKDGDRRNNQGMLTPSWNATRTEFVSTGTGYFTGGIAELADGSIHQIAQHDNSGFIKLVRHINPNPEENPVNLVWELDANGLKIKRKLTSLTIYPGCDHTSVTCKKLGNMVNFGGFPQMTDGNPFVGTHVPQGG